MSFLNRNLKATNTAPSSKQNKLAKVFVCLSLCLSLSSIANPNLALEEGESLKPLSFETKPNTFIYEPNGQMQLITVYPAVFQSQQNSKFNTRAIKGGYCPMSIIDVSNRAWYVPVSLAEQHVHMNVKSKKHNPDCSVSIDYEGTANGHWELNQTATTIVVNGSGRIAFVGYGILSLKEEDEIFKLLDQNKTTNQQSLAAN